MPNTLYSLIVVTDGANEILVGGSLGLFVVPVVVGVGTGKELASRRWVLAVSRPDHLDIVVIIRTDDGRHVKVRQVTPSVEGDFSQHARVVRFSIDNGVVVSLPSVRKHDLDPLVATNPDGREVGRIGVAAEVHRAVLRVLRDECDRVSHDRGGGS